MHWDKISPRRVLGDLEDLSSQIGFRKGVFQEFAENFVNSRDRLLRYGDPALDPFGGLISRHLRKFDDGFRIVTYLRHDDDTTFDRVADVLARESSQRPLVLTGISTVQRRLRTLLREEVLRFSILAFVLSFSIVWLYVRRFKLAVAVILPQILAMLWVIGAMSLCGLGIGPVNLIVFPLILGIGVDSCVYLSERLRRESSVFEALTSTARAILLSTSTTIAGFGFLAFSDYPALAQLGGLTAIGLILCSVTTFTVLPFVYRLDRRREDFPSI